MASRTTSTYSHIQLINWESYQSKGQASGHTEGNRRATTKESKEIKNKENNTTGTPPEIKKDFFSIELERVSDTGLKNALTEWWHYKKGKYQEV